MDRQPQQQPLSCRLCRTRKLRCNRVFPCSNCTTRGVVCNPQSSNNGKNGVSGTKDVSIIKDMSIVKKVSVARDVSVAKGITAAELLSRLERLETLVTSNAMSQEPQRLRHELDQQSLLSRISNSYPEINQLSSVSSLSGDSAVVPEWLQRLTADASKLERSCLGGKHLVSLPIVHALFAVIYCTYLSAGLI